MTERAGADFPELDVMRLAKRGTGAQEAQHIEFPLSANDELLNSRKTSELPVVPERWDTPGLRPRH